MSTYPHISTLPLFTCPHCLESHSGEFRTQHQLTTACRKRRKDLTTLRQMTQRGLVPVACADTRNGFASKLLEETKIPHRWVSRAIKEALPTGQFTSSTWFVPPNIAEVLQAILALDDGLAGTLRPETLNFTMYLNGAKQLLRRVRANEEDAQIVKTEIRLVPMHDLLRRGF